MKCKHKWIDMEDGTNDQICVKCRKFAMRAVMETPLNPTIAAPIAEGLSAGINKSNEDIAKIIQEQLNRSTMMAMSRANRRD